MKVGMLHSRRGPAGMWAPSCEAAAIVAAAEINASGGVLGDEVELIFADCGQTEREAVRAVDFLLDIDGVDAVVGTHTSDIRDAVSAHLAGRVPYIYTSQNEGLRPAPSTITIGSVDAELLAPSIHWLAEAKGATRFFFVGNDYIWPRTTLRTTRKMLADRGAQLVGQALFPVGAADYSSVLREIRRHRPDVVVTALVGTCSIDFMRAFGAAGLDEKILRFALILDETVICGVGAENTTNLYTASHYFANRRSAGNDHFLELYHDAFGDLAPPASAESLGNYEGLHVLASLARRAGVNDGPTLARHLRRPLSRQLARNGLDRSPIGAFPPVHIAAADGVTLRVVASI
jgi:urea transport system substrate-binding protein